MIHPEGGSRLMPDQQEKQDRELDEQGHRE
jgi:hypothetical protein